MTTTMFMSLPRTDAEEFGADPEMGLLGRNERDLEAHT